MWDILVIIFVWILDAMSDCIEHMDPWMCVGTVFLSLQILRLDCFIYTSLLNMYRCGGWITERKSVYIVVIALQKHPPFELLIFCNIHHYISTIKGTLLTTSFTITFIVIFFTVFHYHPKIFALCWYQCDHSTFYSFNNGI